jgi:predicted phage terminase large subunit-like protein
MELPRKFYKIQNESVPLMSLVPEDVQAEQLRLELRLKLLEAHDAARNNFFSYVRYMWPEAILGAHHKKMAEAFDRIANGTLKRLIINMPPRHTKSEFASFLLPSYLMGRDPRLQVIEATHTAELAVKFGRKVRDVMDTDEYGELFPAVKLKVDSKAAGRWDTSKGGSYFAVGVGGAVTGRGADLLIIDDPHSEQDAMSELALENAWEWYQGGPRTRLQPGGAIVLVMTRWGTRDLTARLLKAQTSHHADRWEVIEFPAILPSGKPLWPEFWKLEELEAVRASLSVQKWNAMYQQQPTNDEGAILKREWWRRWEYEDSPAVDYMIQSYDTAYSKKETADYSVITTWGVFYPSADEGAHIILLAVKRGRWDFPELKRVALEEYKVWQPDNVLIEAKATGITLQQEMRRAGIPVTMYTPGGRRAGTDKVSRANSIAPLLESGMVWAPETNWADELIEECAAFPNGDHDDMVDSTTQALMRFRQGNFLQLAIDEVEDEAQEDGLVPEYY